VRRADLLAIRKCDGENVRSFFARIKGKAATCSYDIDCPQVGCGHSVNFTNVIAKDVLISGLAEDEIKREVIGWAGLDKSTIEETVSFIEAKEMAREALNRHSSTNSISSYRQKNKATKKENQHTNCQSCNIEMDRYSWSRRQKKMIERKLCLPCWQQNNARASPKHNTQRTERIGDDAGAIAVGSISTNSDRLEHMLFQPGKGWKRIESMQHPTLQLSVSIDPNDYRELGRPAPKVQPTKVTVVTDTGTQSCLGDCQISLGVDSSPKTCCQSNTHCTLQTKKR